VNLVAILCPFSRVSKVIAVTLAIAACVFITSSMKVGALTQTASVLASSGDTEIRSANSVVNRGSATTVTVDGDESAGTSKNRAALIRFSLPTLPAGATITDTKLLLNVTKRSTNTYSVFVMKKPWVEGEATWNMYKTAGAWDLAGGRGATDRESPAIASITPRATGVQDFHLGAAFDQQVGDWMSGEEANDGIQLINTEATDGFSFSTREVATASQRPQLIITYDEGIVADTTPPETTITSGPAEGETLTVDPATFGFSSSETGSTFECSLDGAAYTACTSPNSYTNLSNGSHTFDVRAKDGAGNVDATPASSTFAVDVPPPPSADTTPPETTIDSWPSGTIKQNYAALTFSANEANSTFECSLDGGTFASCSSPNSYPNLSDGSHTFQVRATDAAGNTDAIPASSTWTVDATAPTVSTAAPTDGATNVAATSNVEATFSEAMDSSTITGSTFTLTKQGSSQPLTAQVSYDSANKMATLDPSVDLEAGTTYTATLKGEALGVKDLADNPLLGADKTWSFSTAAVPVPLPDITPPETTIDSGPSGTVGTSSASFAFSSSETGSTFECSLDGAAYTACTSPNSYTNLSNGSHTFDVRAKDGAGNVDATPASTTFSVEVSPPPDPGTRRAERSLDHMYTRSQTDAELDFWLDKLAATGAETVQTAGPWDHLEPSADDYYSWAFMDRFIAHAEARGLKVRMQVTATPDWVHPYLASQGIAQSDRVWYPPRGSSEIALYQDFWHDLVARYGTRVASYEVWNEPNLDSFFEPEANVSEYAAMQRAAYLGAKSADPNVQIVCCALSQNDIGYLDQLYTALRAYPDAAANDDFFDALGVHPYAYSGSTPLAPDATRGDYAGRFGPLDYTFVGIDKMIADLDAHGDSHKKVWIGEFGYRITSGGYHQPIPDDLRAQYLKQAYALLDQRPRVMGMAWFSYYREPNWALVNRSTRVESVSFGAFRQAAVRN
jgi:methionine-rich copper-binding protein CopC